MEIIKMGKRIAWITGAGSGIGEHTAIQLVQEGFFVILSGRTREKLENVAEKCSPNASVKVVDVSNFSKVSRVFDEIIAEYERIDLLVASAGLNIPKRNWHNIEAEGFDEVVKTDLNGVFYTNKLAVAQMKKQKMGLIINISSWAGKYVSTLTGPAYTAAKHAVNALTESINMEAGHFGVRACAICPGEVATPILERRPIPVSKSDRDKMVQPEDCAMTIVFLTRLPERVCINELTISPTWNRDYVARLNEQIPKE
jgi:NADP-dependent 3-hydroxy acid dehydrogenase YdfG